MRLAALVTLAVLSVASPASAEPSAPPERRDGIAEAMDRLLSRDAGEDDVSETKAEPAAQQECRLIATRRPA